MIFKMILDIWFIKCIFLYVIILLNVIIIRYKISLYILNIIINVIIFLNLYCKWL